MKNLRKYLGLILFLFLAGIMNSCMKDDLSKADSEDTATVTLHINDSRSGGTSPVEAGEGIKTLRVIVLDAGNKVEFNYKQSFGNETDLQTEKTVTFLGMTTGIKKFYVVANEESLGLNDTDYPAKGTQVINPNDLLNKVITDTERSHFPKLKGKVKSLPITGYKEVRITADTKNIPIETYHAVAKIVFKVKNTSSEDITLTGFSLGEFFADRTYLFPSVIEQLDVNYAAFDRRNDVSGTFTAGAEATEYFTCYLYETPEDKKSDFKVTLFTNNQDLDLPEATINLNEATDYVVKRNTVINIVATISKEATVTTPVKVTLNWQVSSWNPVTNNVPSFN